jgi:hypothetical protein
MVVIKVICGYFTLNYHMLLRVTGGYGGFFIGGYWWIFY